jgi:biopolymer transport protein ExbD
MARRRLQLEEDATTIDLSSMIDCIFILLIFFIVTTVFVEEKGMQVAKPDSAAVAPASDEEVTKVVLELSEGGEIKVDGRVVPLADVPERVRSGVEDESTPVVIRAHQKASHGAFVALWDAAQRGGAVTLSFNTVN